MEKSELLRVRVTPKMKGDFEAICKNLGDIQPADKLRELVEAFVDAHIDSLGDRVAVHISKPHGYDPGAWQVFIKLRDKEESIWHGSSIPFPLPDTFKKRRLSSDREYQAVVGVAISKGFNQYEMGGVFVNGEWRGHLYSNGIEEGQNPTSIEEVKAGLVAHISRHLDKFKPA